jgi:short-subunit dehydrogenase
MHSRKTVLVTGASSGIGKAIAEQLIAEGHLVYVAARRLEKMKDLEEKGATAIKLDITNEDDILNLVNQIEENHGGVDVLVNNAGYAIYGSVEETTIDDARRQFEVNVFGLASLTQKLIPHMRKQRSGTIINITSMGGKIYTSLGAWYHATKHALEGWSDCLRIELNQFNVNVVVVEPGAIKTEFGDVMYQPMVDRSGEGPYKKLVDTMVRMGREAYENPNSSSPPSVIADEVSRAIKTNKPKTRYVAGKMAKPMMFARKWLGDKTFDKMLLSRVK